MGDTLVIAPLQHLFSVPRGIFLSGTINGSRWVYKRRGKILANGLQEEIRGPPMINTGCMVISPDTRFIPALLEVLDIPDWHTAGGWAECGERSAEFVRSSGVARNVCSQWG